MSRLLLLILVLSVGGGMAHADEKKAILAGGCFWCLEKDFDQLDGVLSAESGYAGGSFDNPTYQNYHDEGPGIIPHVEVVQVTYDSSKLSYKEVLNYFYRHIDPLDGGGQFCDRGPGYRPAIFVADDKEKKIAEEVTKEVASLLDKEIQVKIEDPATFWKAEEYHQKYYTKNPLRYKYYRYSCGRDKRVEEVWKGR